MLVLPPTQSLLAVLAEDPSPEVCQSLQRPALEKMCSIVPMIWCEVADELELLESFYEKCGDEDCRQLGALLLSQTYFNLELYGSALNYALLSDYQFLELLNSFYPVDASFLKNGRRMNRSRVRDHASEKMTENLKLYVDQIVALAIDEFIRYRTEQRSMKVFSAASPSDDMAMNLSSRVQEDQASSVPQTAPTKNGFQQNQVDIDSRKVEELVNVLLAVEDLEKASLCDATLKLILGIALEADDMEKVSKLFSRKSSAFALMRCVISNHEVLMATKHQRMKVFKLMASVYQHEFKALFDLTAASGSSLTINQIPKEAYEELTSFSEVLVSLGNVEDMALLIGGLIKASCGVDDVSNVSEKNILWLRALQLAFDVVACAPQSFLNDLRKHPMLVTAPESEPERPAFASEMAPQEDSSKDTDQTPDDHRAKLLKLNKVLLGDYQKNLHLKFSNQQNDTDLPVLDVIKKSLEARHAALHTALITAHGFMQRGTTNDIFLRRNLDWFGRSLCWGKLTATASLGVIHQTHAEKSFRVLSTYLPGIAPAGTNSAFSDGGSLYALGLIHANRGDQPIITYLLEQLISGSGGANQSNGAESTRRTVNEIAQYGACLGLGLAAIGAADSTLVETLRNVLLMDSTVSGEAAALGIGLVLLGTGDLAMIEELLQYAKDTRHDKIIRACGLAVAMICHECEEDVSAVLQRMISSSDPLVRYGGCFAIGLSHCGTSSNTCLTQLLHLAVSDSNDEVKRAAVLAIPFLLCGNPEQTPRVLRLLAESFNLHLRFATILAIGISCAGTASAEALEIVVPATRDAADVVRQGAFIALGMIMMQCPEPVVKSSAAGENRRPSVSGDNGKTPENETNKATTQNEKGDGSNAESRNEKKPMKTSQSKILANQPTSDAVREHFIAISTESRENQMARIGAIIGLGLLDAGGKNACCSFFSSRGLIRRESIVGFLLFAQYWYWYPLLHNISLAMVPTVLIGVTGDLDVPEEYQVECLAPKSRFAYPPKHQIQKKAAVAKTVVTKLSAANKKKKLEDLARPLPPPVLEKAPVVNDTTEPEAPTHMISNMTRLLHSQLPLFRHPPNARYTPVFSNRKVTGGIVVLVDNDPSKTEPAAIPSNDSQATV